MGVAVVVVVVVVVVAAVADAVAVVIVVITRSSSSSSSSSSTRAVAAVVVRAISRHCRGGGECPNSCRDLVKKKMCAHTHTNTLRTHAFQRHVLGVRARQSQSTLSNLTP